MAMNVNQVLHMKEGTSEASYAKSSYIQKQVLELTKATKDEAIKELYNSIRPVTICIADLGCSSNDLNTLSVVSEIIDTLEKARQELGNGDGNGYKHEHRNRNGNGHRHEHESHDYQVFLNDLPGNDFNTLFKSVASFQDNLKKKGDSLGRCFVNGVPGSFYERLFPANTLHFVHASYSLMWLSQVPEGIEGNKRNIYMASTSPPNVLQAYYDQFHKDFSLFLNYRSEEVVGGGKMVLTILGRKSDERYTRESCCMWELLATVLDDMVFEGIIEEEKLKSFNIPQYTPSAAEVRFLVEREGSFAVNQVHVSEVKWNITDDHHENGHSGFAKCMRSVAEPLLISHFGESIIEDVFQRYTDEIGVLMAKDKNAVFINITVSLTKI